MIPQTRPICENITLHTVKSEKFKTGMLSLSISMPMSASTSVCNSLLAGIMRRGTEKYPSVSSVNRRLDELYASVVEIKTAKYGKNEMLIISSELLDNSYATDGTDIADGVLEVISQLLFHPLVSSDGAFVEKNVTQEKKLLVDALRAEINNPRVYALTKLVESLNRNDPRRATTKQMIEIAQNTDRYSLTEHYKSNILDKKIDIFYVGSLDADELTSKITAHFPTVTDCPERKILPVCAEKPCGDAIELSEDMPVSQGKLAIGFRTGVCIDSDKYPSLIVMNEILGGSPASKLFMNVREKLSLCYYCSSSYNMYNGNLIISSGIEVEDKDKAYSAILRELDDVKLGRISQSEFDSAKKSLENGYRQIYDNPFELHGFYSGRMLFGIRDTVDDCRERIAKVTLEDVIAVSQGVTLDTVFFLRGTLTTDVEDEDDE